MTRVQGVTRVHENPVERVHRGLLLLPADVLGHVQPGGEGDEVFYLHPVFSEREALELDGKDVRRLAYQHLFVCPDHVFALRAAVFVVPVEDLLAREHVQGLLEGPRSEYFQTQIQDGVVLVRLVVAARAVNLAPELAPKDSVDEALLHLLLRGLLVASAQAYSRGEALLHALHQARKVLVGVLLPAKPEPVARKELERTRKLVGRNDFAGSPQHSVHVALEHLHGIELRARGVVALPPVRQERVVLVLQARLGQGGGVSQALEDRVHETGVAQVVQAGAGPEHDTPIVQGGDVAPVLVHHVRACGRRSAVAVRAGVLQRFARMLLHLWGTGLA
mmetsp:Transcript_2480/g.6836  ORF Transcript_2480/g.6836 Transcript_2480/m.6836 type:complete len:334 (+) Transcript_2480:1136-2137(+)